MLYKYINKDTIERAPNWVTKDIEYIDEETGEKIIDGAIISNPSEETLRELGYTDLISEEDLSSVDNKYIKNYELINNKIYERYVLKESDN